MKIITYDSFWRIYEMPDYSNKWWEYFHLYNYPLLEIRYSNIMVVLIKCVD